MNFSYSIVLGQLIACIYETVEEVDTAPLFRIEYLNNLYMSRMKHPGLSTQPVSTERAMLTYCLTGAQERKRHPACTPAVIQLI